MIADKMDSHSRPKYRKNNEKMITFFYSSIFVTIGLSLAVYGASIYGYSENLMATRVYFTFMYLSSAAAIIGLWIFLFVNRKLTYETQIKNGNANGPFIFSNKGENVNMYLRFGLAIYGICTLIYIVTATYIRNIDADSSESTILLGISQGLFIATQTIFILVYHRLVLLFHGYAIKFVFLHLMITNLLLWANASIGKVLAEFESISNCRLYNIGIACKICTYLSPAVCEYAVIAAAVVYDIYLRVGKDSLIELDKHEKKTLAMKCNDIVPGIPIGCLILVICIFTSISSVVIPQFIKRARWMYHVHSSEMIILNVLGIIFLIVAINKVRIMKFSVTLTKSSLDENILFVSYILAICFSWLVLIICGRHLDLDLTPQYSIDLKLRLCSAVLEIIQITFQTYFIKACFQRCSHDERQKEIKPGKNYIAILIAINFGMWFLWTLQMKTADIIHLKRKGNYTFIPNGDNSSFQGLLLFFLQVTWPLGMLYRYHSSACLSDIFSKIYQTESERFLEHIRLGKFDMQNYLAETLRNIETPIRKNFQFSDLSYDIDDMNDKRILTRCQSELNLAKSIMPDVQTDICRKPTLTNMLKAHFKYISGIFSRNIPQNDSFVDREVLEENQIPASEVTDEIDIEDISTDLGDNNTCVGRDCDM